MTLSKLKSYSVNEGERHFVWKMDETCNQAVFDAFGEPIKIRSTDEFKPERVDKSNKYYKPFLTLLDVKHLTSALGIKKDEMDSKESLIIADRKDNAFTQMYNIGSFLNAGSFYYGKGKSILMAEIEDTSKMNTYRRNRKKVYMGRFITHDKQIGEGAAEYIETQLLQAVDTKKGNIKSTSSFVIDIDFDMTNGYLSQEDITRFAEMLDFALCEIGMPANSYIYTGTGLHVYYYYNKVYWQNYAKEKACTSILEDTYDRVYKIVKELAIKVADLLSGSLKPLQNSNYKISVDRISVNRPMVRVVGSLHEQSYKRCTCVKFNDNLRRWILSDLLYTAKNYLDEKPTGREWVDYKKKYGKNSQVFRDNISRLNNDRISDYKTILIEYGQGYRNRAYCNLVVAMLNQAYDIEDIKKELFDFDTQNNVGYFKNEHQVESLVMSVKEWFDRHPKNILNQVPLTNETVLNFMNLDRESVSDLNLKTLGNIPRSIIREEKRVQKQSLLDKFLAAYKNAWIEGNINISELARKFAVSRTTIYNWITKLANKIAEFVKEHIKGSDKEVMETPEAIDKSSVKEDETSGIVDKCIKGVNEILPYIAEDGTFIGDKSIMLNKLRL